MMSSSNHGMSSVITMETMDMAKSQDVAGMPAMVQRSSSLDSMQPPMMPPATNTFPIPVPTCTHIMTNSMPATYTPAAVQRSRSLPLLDQAPAIPPEILAQITERTSGPNNDNDGLGMNQNGNQTAVDMMGREYVVQESQNSAGMPGQNMGHNGMGNTQGVVQNTGMNPNLANRISQSPGINQGVVPQSPGINPGVVPQSPGINQGVVPQSPGIVPQSPGINQGVVPQSPGMNQGVVPQSPGINQGIVPQSPGIVPQSPGINQGVVPQSPGINQGVVPQSPGIQSPGIPSPGMQPLNLSQSGTDGNKQLFFPPSGPGMVGRHIRQSRNYMPPISEYNYQTTRFPFRPTEPVPISYGFPQHTANISMSNSHMGKIEGAYGFLSSDNAQQLINVSQGMGGGFLQPPRMFITRPVKDEQHGKVGPRPLLVGPGDQQHDNNNDKTSPNMQAMSEHVPSHLMGDKGLLPLSVNVSAAFADPNQENSPASLSRQSNSPALLRFKALASDQMLSMLNYNDEQLLQDGGGLIADENFLIQAGQRLADHSNLAGMDSNPASVNNEPFDLFESGNPGEVDDTPSYMADSLSPPPQPLDQETVTSLSTIVSTGSDSVVSSRVVMTRDGTSVVVSNHLSAQGSVSGAAPQLGVAPTSLPPGAPPGALAAGTQLTTLPLPTQQPPSTGRNEAPSTTARARGKGRPRSNQPGHRYSQPCPVCQKVFGSSSALAKHKLIHSSERRHKCLLCAKSFKRQDHLTGHMLTHRSKKPYECAVDNCGKSYCDIRSLRRHFESQHPGLAMEDHMTYTGDEKDPELMAAEAAAQASHQNQQALAAAAAVNTNPTQYMNTMTNIAGSNTTGPISQMLQGTPPNPSPSPESSSSSSAALQFLAQAAQRAQGSMPLQPPSPTNSQSPTHSSGQGNNSHIPVPQDVPGLYRIDDYSSQTFSGLAGSVASSQSVPTTGAQQVLRFQQNNLSNPLLRPMLSTRDAMLGTAPTGTGKGHHKSHDKEPKERTPVECSVCKRTFKSMPALNGHMRLHGGYNNTRADLEHRERSNKQSQQHQPRDHQLSQANNRHHSASPIQTSQQHGAPLTLQHSGPLTMPPTSQPRTTAAGGYSTDMSLPPPVSLSIPSVPLSLSPQNQIMHTSPPQRPIVKQEPMTQLPPAPLANFPSYMFPPSQYMPSVYPQPPLPPQPTLPPQQLFINPMTNRVQAATPPRPPSSCSPMQLQRLMAPLEPQGGTAPIQGRHLGSPMGQLVMDRDPSPPQLEAIRPQIEMYERSQPPQFERMLTERTIMDSRTQPTIFIEPSRESPLMHIVKSEPPLKSKLELALMGDAKKSDGPVISSESRTVTASDSGVFRTPPVHPSPTKKKPRPTPLHIPSCVNTATPGSIIPGTYQSQMRSPREMGGFYHRSGTTPPPYTPPPMLSPIRSGSGLYFNAGAATLSVSGGITPKAHPPLTPGLISMHRRSSSAFPLMSPVPTSSTEEQPVYPSSEPHINVGVDYQASIPEYGVVSREDIKFQPDVREGTLMFHSSTVDKYTEHEVHNFLELATTAALPGGARNTEFAHHCLQEADGDIELALEMLLGKKALHPDGHELADFKYDFTSIWDISERKEFRDQYKAKGKDFYDIQKTLPNKTVQEIVEYYYRWKKLFPYNADMQKFCHHSGYNPNEENRKMECDLFADEIFLDYVPFKEYRNDKYYRGPPAGKTNNHVKPSSQSQDDKAPSTGPFACGYPDCYASFKSRQALNGHIRVHGGSYKAPNKDIKDLKAASASSRCGTPDSAMSVGSIPRRNSTDSSCSEALERSVPVPPPEEFPCRICGKVFFKVKSRSAHMKSHRNPDSKKQNGPNTVTPPKPKKTKPKPKPLPPKPITPISLSPISPISPIRNHFKPESISSLSSSEDEMEQDDFRRDDSGSDDDRTQGYDDSGSESGSRSSSGSPLSDASDFGSDDGNDTMDMDDKDDAFYD